MTTLDQVAAKIIKEQELIIGPVAWEEARKVKGVHVVDEERDTVTIQNGDGREVVNNLVGQYEHLFGRASREVCREAAAALIADFAPEQIPSSLR